MYDGEVAALAERLVRERDVAVSTLRSDDLAKVAAMDGGSRAVAEAGEEGHARQLKDEL